MLKCDFHIHTSDDPVDYIEHSTYGLIDRAAALGLGALAITLHDRQLDEECLRDYARDRGIVLLPGVERTIAGKHVVLVNFPAEAERVGSFEELRALKARSNGLVIAPHPFFPGASCLRSLMDAHADVFDAVEWSYFWTAGVNFNAAARRWARDRGKPLVGNSDLHHIRQLGRTCSWVAAEADPAAICEAVRAGHVSVQTEPVPLPELAHVFGGMVWRGRKPTEQLGLASGRVQPAIAGAIPSITD
ncbi:MAG: PHP-associated domain-containing protein [Acidobacteriota bacterium]